MSHNINYISDKDGQTIDPLFANSDSGGVEKVTLSSNTGQGSAQTCRTCLVKPDSSNTETVMLNIGGTADANDFPLDSAATAIPVDNTNLLYFYSADANAIVYILYRD